MQQRKEEGFPGMAAEVISHKGALQFLPSRQGGARLAERKSGSSINIWKNLYPSSPVIKKKKMDINDTNV